MELNKLYICGASHSGKSLLWELIDRNQNVIVAPHHNFGLSHIYEEFMIRVIKSQYAYKKWLLNPKYNRKYV